MQPPTIPENYQSKTLNIFYSNSTGNGGLNITDNRIMFRVPAYKSDYPQYNLKMQQAWAACKVKGLTVQQCMDSLTDYKLA